MKKIKVRLKDNSYEIVVGKKILPQLGKFITELNLGNKAFIISNPTVKKLYGNRISAALKRCPFATQFIIVPDSEKAKSAAVALRVIEKIAGASALNKPFLIALGGGVVGDLTGFVASVYKRGIPYIQVPTTLLADVDASIGGKTAIDLPIAKNMVGTFNQPKLVFIDTDFLRTLPSRQIGNGMAEVVKYAVINEAKLFYLLEHAPAVLPAHEQALLEKIVYRCANIKAKFVSADEKEKLGIRTLLNYGHTIGHAIEQASGYSSRIFHGEAVSIGMVVGARLAVRLNMLNQNHAARIERLLLRLGLPIRLKNVSRHKIFSSVMHDKKFINGKIRLVLPVKIGMAVVSDSVDKRIFLSMIDANISK